MVRLKADLLHIVLKAGSIWDEIESNEPRFGYGMLSRGGDRRGPAYGRNILVKV